MPSPTSAGSPNIGLIGYKSTPRMFLPDQIVPDRFGLIQLGHISQLDKFFTDMPLSSDMAQTFLAAKVEVVMADQNQG